MNSSQRVSGVLLHPTSLPGPEGLGNIGPEAYRWVNFLKNSGTQLWQILPLGPTGYGDSPYQCFSAFAGNAYLVSSEILLDQGLLQESDLQDRPDFPEEEIELALPAMAAGFAQSRVSQLQKSRPKRDARAVRGIPQCGGFLAAGIQPVYGLESRTRRQTLV